MSALPAPPMPLSPTGYESNRFVGSLTCFGGARDLLSLRGEDLCLPGGTIDGCAMMVQHLLDTQPSSCAIFPNYVWQFFVRNNRIADVRTWNLVRRTRYWEKLVWMVPINYQGNHWYLGVVDIRQSIVWIFDSLYCKANISSRSQVRRPLTSAVQAE